MNSLTELCLLHHSIVSSYRHFIQGSIPLKNEIEDTRDKLMTTDDPKSFGKSLNRIFQDAKEYLGLLEKDLSEADVEDENSVKIAKQIAKSMHNLKFVLKDVEELAAEAKDTSPFRSALAKIRSLRKEIENKFSRIDPSKFLAHATSPEEVFEWVTSISKIHHALTAE